MTELSPQEVIQARIDREQTEKQRIAEVRASLVAQEIMPMLDAIPSIIKADEYRHCSRFYWEGAYYTSRNLQDVTEDIFIGGIPLKVLFNDQADSLTILDARTSWTKFPDSGLATENTIQAFAVAHYEEAAKTAGVLRFHIESTNPDSQYEKDETTSDYNNMIRMANTLHELRDEQVRHILESQQNS